MSDDPLTSISSPGAPLTMSSDEQDDRALVAYVTRYLDQSVEQLDPATLARLRHARVEAVESRSQAAKLPIGVWWLPASVVAVLTVLVLTVWVWSLRGPHDHEVWPLEDVELLASAEPFEFYEDLEFYHWLTAEDHAS